MKQEKIRMLIAVAASMVVLLVWQLFFAPKPTPAPVNTVTEKSENTSSQTAAVDIVTEQVTPKLAKDIITIEKNDFIIEFDKNTGNISSLKPKRFEEAMPTFMTDKGDYGTISLGTHSAYKLTTQETPDATVLVFTARTPQISVTKEYTVKNNDIIIPLKIKIKNLTSAAINVPMIATAGPGLGKDFGPSKYLYVGPITGHKDDFIKKASKTIDNPLWGGVTSKYFMFGFIGSFDKSEIIEEPNKEQLVKLTKTIVVPAGEEYIIEDMSVYAGAKSYDKMKAMEIGLHKTVEYGTLYFLAIPMTKIMNAAYGIVGNYGIAIIILTIIVKILTLPLTLKSMKSMKAMSKLQPEMAKLKEKFKDEPQKLNAATMELYKQHKINPMSGCFPIVIQLPVFLALYRSLLVSVELRGAPFFGWITDLSVQDPYYITPVLMGVSMFVSQKMSQSPAMDPLQQKIFLFMPLIFTFMFLNFPAGLVVYWLTNNILTIIQQLILNKRTN